MNTNRKYYYALDIAKIFWAIVVVAIHTNLFLDNPRLYSIRQHITSFAVEFFLVASGFMLQENINNCPTEMKKTIKKYVKRLVRPFLVWGGGMQPFQLFRMS